MSQDSNEVTEGGELRHDEQVPDSSQGVPGTPAEPQPVTVAPTGEVPDPVADHVVPEEKVFEDDTVRTTEDEALRVGTESDTDDN